MRDEWCISFANVGTATGGTEGKGRLQCTTAQVPPGWLRAAHLISNFAERIDSDRKNRNRRAILLQSQLQMVSVVVRATILQ